MVMRIGFFDNIIKGRIAECIVEELFKQSGYRVYRFGYESVLQNLTQSGKRLKRRDVFNKQVRSMPDFILEKDGYLDYLEVKFRSGGLNKKDIDNVWHDSWLLLVTPKEPFFEIVDVGKFLRGKENFKPLVKEKEIELNDKALKKAIYLTEKYLTI